MAALQLSSLFHFDLLYGDAMVFDGCRTCSFLKIREEARRALGGTWAHNSLHLEEAPSVHLRSDGNMSLWRRVRASFPRETEENRERVWWGSRE